MDLSELLPRYAPNLYANISEADQRFASYNGKLLAVPSHGDKNTGTYFAVRSDIAKRCGITQINTVEDIDKALKIIKDKESVRPIYGESLYLSILMKPSKFFHIEGPFWYRKNDPDMKIHPYEQFEEYSRASELYRKWKTSGYYSETIDGAASFITTGLELIDYYRKGSISDNYELFSLYPSDENYANQTLVHGIAINKDSKKAEYVLRFLEWVYSDRSNYDLIMYGIEGANYTLKNGYIKPDEKNSLINWYGSEAFLRYDFERLHENDPELLVKSLYKKMLEVGYQLPPHYGFAPDLSKIWDKLQYTRYTAEQSRIETEVFEGTSDMTIGEYIQYQKELGADDIAKELQTQLNAWLLKNKVQH